MLRGMSVLPDRVAACKNYGNPVETRARRPSCEAVLSWRDAYPVVDTSATVLVNATDGLTIRDSVVLAASAEAECRLLLSEDSSGRVYVAGRHPWTAFLGSNPLAKRLVYSALE
jgi:hypothetical protein